MEIPMKEQAITFSLFALLIGFPVERIAQTESVFGSVLICRGRPSVGAHFCRAAHLRRAPTEGRPYRLRHCSVNVRTRESHPRKWVDGSDPTYKEMASEA